MTPDRPQGFRWDGEAMLPLSPRNADKAYCVGEVYRLVVHEDRSINSHRHEFAWLREAWKTLPERLAELFPSPEHLRKRALIDAGYYHENAIDAGSNAAALRVAAYLKAADDFKLVIVRGPIVLIREAKSQSMRVMGKKDFQDSKDAILEIVSAMLDVPSADLRREAERAA